MVAKVPFRDGLSLRETRTRGSERVSFSLRTTFDQGNSNCCSLPGYGINRSSWKGITCPVEKLIRLPRRITKTLSFIYVDQFGFPCISMESVVLKRRKYSFAERQIVINSQYAI